MDKCHRIESLSIVVYDGHYDKIHYALSMASTAGALNMATTLFFTMDACSALKQNYSWRELPLSGVVGSGQIMDNNFKVQNIASFEDLLSACVDLGIKFMVCEMGLKTQEITLNELRQDIPFEQGGLATFLSNASKHGSIIFI